MARPSNPNKEKIQAIKSELKDQNKIVRQGETASKKVAKLEERLAKYTDVDTPVKSSKVKADKAAKTGSKKKVDAKAEKKSGKVVTQVKKRGRPKKDVSEDEDD